MDSGASLGSGRYVVRGVLGEGAQGTTYDAFDNRDQRAVAIKRFDVRGARSWKDVELAEREARVLATIDHPLVPRYVEHFEENGALYLVMEKIEGETLESIRRRQGPLPEDEVRRFLSCADRALTYLHGRSSPIVHRDVKPRNVVRREDGSYVFVDFGAVSEVLFRRGGSTIVGTIGYMAPEQLQGRALPATDVYAVGATALAALTGAEPDTLPHRGLRVDARGALEGRASPALISSLERMLEPDPERRTSSVGGALVASEASEASEASGGANKPALEAPPPASLPPFLPTSMGTIERAKEDAVVKSIRNLLWVLWGLSWIMVPLVLSELDLERFVPLVMFGSLAALFVVVWHKGALIRAAVRAVTGKTPAEAALVTATLPRQRVELGQGHDRQVRVHTAELRPDELVGQTSVGSEQPARAQARR